MYIVQVFKKKKNNFILFAFYIKTAFIYVRIVLLLQSFLTEFELCTVSYYFVSTHVAESSANKTQILNQPR
jgi:hypothetical protein